MSVYDDVYGISFDTAKQQIDILNQEIAQQYAKGFDSEDDVANWAKHHLLDKVVYQNMNHKFFYVSHKGELLTTQTYFDYYKDVLFYGIQSRNKIIRTPWIPSGFTYYNASYIAGEQSDGTHKPLYYRDYFVPTGYYNPLRDAFNVAKPFPVFAKETGRDTSHIYEYMKHVAGECYMWLLAWLRTKMMYPTVKTQVVPIIVSRAQGSGKTTFAEVICKGCFGSDNVLVTDQYDSQSRFNSDYADALIVCQEEKEETDVRNPAGTLKSRATATTIRKEQKGVDPIYQESYTEFIMTTNKDVPIKFDGREDQRRFMIMNADEHFTRKESKLADEVFSKLYGFDADFNKVGIPFNEDHELIAQFKHELFTNKKIAEVKLREFPKTAAYNKCFTLPRTTDATEIEAILRALAPFIKASLVEERLVSVIDDSNIEDIIFNVDAFAFFPGYKQMHKFVGLCRPLVFYETGNMKPYAHSVVERTIYDCASWLRNDYGLKVVPDTEPLRGGFPGVKGRYKMAPVARFVLVDDNTNEHSSYDSVHIDNPKEHQHSMPVREGQRLRVNNKFIADDDGCYETVNEMKPGIKTLKNKSMCVQYMDTFLLESDNTNYLYQQLENTRIEKLKLIEDNPSIDSQILYKERLQLALTESMNLFNKGIVARIVYSGAKSYHLLVRVLDAPTTLEEYRWLHGYLCNTLTDKLVFDESTCDPARLTRSPLQLARTSMNNGVLVEGTQELICEDWSHVYSVKWREAFNAWKNRPLEKTEIYGIRCTPTREEYREACDALIDTSFWTDSKWDGRRQKCFFAGYRILRLLGYTHEKLWSDIILKGVEKYKKPAEITYWKTREQSNIIKQIDEQIDEYTNSITGGQDEE